jgi:hypothetical protein
MESVGCLTTNLMAVDGVWGCSFDVGSCFMDSERCWWLFVLCEQCVGGYLFFVERWLVFVLGVR